MQELGRVKVKVNLGVGLNLLCVAGASYVAVKTLTKMAEFNNAIKHGETIDLLKENCKELNEMMKSKNAETKATDNAEEKTEESV